LIKQIPADEILAHRIVWSFILMLFIVALSKKSHLSFKNSFHKKTVLLVFLCAVFICINWFVYIWSVNSGHVIEASMGYFINPLVAVLLGVTVLKEKLSRWEKGALSLAAAGVLISIAAYGRIPWISLILAVSFALYGLLKKLLPLDPSVGLTMETAIMAPFALGYILFKQSAGFGALGRINLPCFVLLLCSGFATAIPLLLFAESAKRVDLSIVGFLQYISPTISFLLGVFVFHERLTGIDVISYFFIWAAIFLFSLSNILPCKSKLEDNV
jgi:chloramphenicol-sensitive protein RarD